MIRLVLLAFSVYQLVTVPNNESAFANGEAGTMYAGAAFVAFLILWGIVAVTNHDEQNPFMPVGIGTLW